MATTQDDQATLASYAQALLELADARGETDNVAADLQSIANLTAADPALHRYLADPSVSHSERAEKIDRVFAGQTSGTLVAFLKLLNAKGRLGSLTGIARELKKLLDVRAGRADVEVTVAQALSPDELENVRVEISKKIGKHAQITQKVDESIIGGLVLKIGDKLVDGSVKSQLETLKRRLIAAV